MYDAIVNQPATGYGPSPTTGYAFLTRDESLAQGSAPPPNVRLPFDVIVLAAEEYQPNLPGYIVIHAPIDDADPTPIERMRIYSAAREVARHIRSGKRVLVTCWMGRNRSGVIAGLALVELGVHPHRAVRRIQKYRNGLGNHHFRAMVEWQ
jgi:protein-tyrosine phosphatase